MATDASGAGRPDHRPRRARRELSPPAARRRRAARSPRVVKADGYGLGARRGRRSALAGRLPKLLRRPSARRAWRCAPLLPDAAIFVLHGLPGEAAATAGRGRADPGAQSPGRARRAMPTLARRRGRRLPAALQIDTGMCRLGFAEAELERLDRSAARRARSAPGDEPSGLRRGAGQSAERGSSARASSGCARCCRRRRRASPTPPGSSSGRRSTTSSAGRAWRSTASIPTPGRANPMAPVVTLEAPVLQVHDGRRRRARSAMARPIRPAPGTRIATVPVGYADGYLRAAERPRDAPASPGRRCRSPGRVSMDLISLDVSALPAGRGAPRHDGRADRRAGRASTSWPRRPAPSATRC